MFAPLFVYSYLTATTGTQEVRPHNERGASFTEYVVLLAIIVAIVVGALAVLDTPLNAAIGRVVTALDGA